MMAFLYVNHVDSSGDTDERRSEEGTGSDGSLNSNGDVTESSARGRIKMRINGGNQGQNVSMPLLHLRM